MIQKVIDQMNASRPIKLIFIFVAAGFLAACPDPQSGSKADLKRI